MRVVLAPEGSRGDVQPLAALGQALAARGCDVLLCAPPDARDLVGELGLAFEPLEIDLRAFLEAQARVVMGSRMGLQRAGLRYFRDCVDTQVRVLARAARGADLIVGGGVQLGARSVAEALGIPYRYVAYCPAFFPSGEHPPLVLEGDIRSRRLNRVLWRGFLAVYGVLLRPRLNAGRAELGLPPVRDFFGYLRSDRPLLASDPELAPAPADCRFPLTQVGYLHPRSDRPLPPKLSDFLAAGPPPVYLGFGSMPDPDPAASTRKLLDAVTEAGLRALVSEGWAGLGRVPLPETALAIGPVPHEHLFPHVAAVVHHGGAGTTSTAARAGVPQIVVPHLLDQFYWARRAHALGLAPPPLPRRKLTAGRLAALLTATMENELVTGRAAELGRRMRARDPWSAAADALLTG